MNIQPINCNKPAPSFKKVYPVQYLVKNGDNYNLITANMTLIRKMQRKLVSILNKSDEYYFNYFYEHPIHSATEKELKQIRAKKFEERVRNFIGRLDIDYRGERINLADKIKKLDMKIKIMELQGLDASKEKKELEKLKKGDSSMVRSFYNTKNGNVVNGTWPSFIISGRKHINEFEKESATHEIGKNKNIAKKNNMEVHSDGTNAAIDIYNTEGYRFVNEPSRRITDENGISYYLRAIFETVRDKQNRIKDYEIIGVKFFPTGKTHP